MSDYQDYGWSQRTTPAHRYLLPTLLQMLDPNRNRLILDFGCGSGYLAHRLLEAGYDVHGVDASASGIEMARADQQDRFHLIQPDASDLPDELAAMNFDTIIATEVIEHLYNPQAFVEFCGRILPTGGEFIVSTPYHGYLKNLALALTGAMDAHFTALWVGGHIKFWSRKTLSQLLVDGGFSPERFVGSGRLPKLWKSMFICARKGVIS